MQVMWTLGLQHHPTAGTHKATSRYIGHMQETSLSCFAVVRVVTHTSSTIHTNWHSVNLYSRIFITFWAPIPLWLHILPWQKGCGALLAHSESPCFHWHYKNWKSLQISRFTLSINPCKCSACNYTRRLGK